MSLQARQVFWSQRLSQGIIQFGLQRPFCFQRRPHDLRFDQPGLDEDLLVIDMAAQSGYPFMVRSLDGEIQARLEQFFIMDGRILPAGLSFDDR